jgi:hypothetical protein
VSFGGFVSRKAATASALEDYGPLCRIDYHEDQVERSEKALH